tara:strand:- start:3485 stop:4414 length:930 start_codon:yes stop_codon:yes gene_type:complete
LSVNKRSDHTDAILLDERPTLEALDHASATYPRGPCHTQTDIVGELETLNLGYVCTINHLVWTVTIPLGSGGGGKETRGVRESVDAFIRFVDRADGQRVVECILPSTRAQDGLDMFYQYWSWQDVDESTLIVSTGNEWTAMGNNMDVRHAFSITEAIQDRDTQCQYNRVERDYSTEFGLTDEQLAEQKDAALQEYGDLPERVKSDEQALEQMKENPEELTMKIQKVRKMLLGMHNVMAYENVGWVKDIVKSVYRHTDSSQDVDEFELEQKEKAKINDIIWGGEMTVKEAERSKSYAQGKLSAGDDELYT